MVTSLPNIIVKADEPNLYRYGKIEGEPNDMYHACDALSRTKLEVFRKSPKLFWKVFVAKILPKEEPSDALIVGQAVDTLALEGPDAFAERFVSTPKGAPRRPTVAQLRAQKPSDKAMESISFWHAFDEANKGKMALDADQISLVKRCADALHENETFQRLLIGGKSQVTFRVKGERVSMQCRPDRWCEDGNELTDGMPCIVDLKTILELPADDDDFLPKHIAKFGYHRGAFLYPEIVANVEKFKNNYRPPFILAFVEKQEPYAVTCRPVSQEAIDVGEREVRDSIFKLIKCIERNYWPEWWNEPMAEVSLPSYYMRRSAESQDSNLFG